MPMINRAAKRYTTKQEFTSSGNFTVPAGVTEGRARLVGGGAGSQQSGYSGGNGYFREFELTLTPGAVMPVVIGAAGPAGGGAGGQTTFAGVAADGGYNGSVNAYLAGGGGWGIYGKGGINAGAGSAGFVEIAY